MDKLQWFKFTPSDWMMGKIQRCPEVTQARFLRLCCLYWNKECKLSIEDAIIEIDKEHFETLKNKKIISVNSTHFNISFLDEQFLEIDEKSKHRSESGIIGNLKRWHPDIYSKFELKKISLKEAIELSKSIATQSLPDSTPIAKQSQNIAEKKREEKKREEKDNIHTAQIIKFSFDDFWELYPNKVGKKLAREKFKKLSDTQVKKIENHLPLFVQNPPFKDYSFPHPTTYLNQERFEDEIQFNNLKNNKNERFSQLTTELRNAYPDA